MMAQWEFAVLSSKLRLGRKIPFRKGNDATSATHSFAVTYAGFWHSEFYVIIPLVVEGLRVVENCVFRQFSLLLKVSLETLLLVLRQVVSERVSPVSVILLVLSWATEKLMFQPQLLERIWTLKTNGSTT
ncbi:minichromosome maintenance MCM2/3/5 family protein [Prunus dulcis]|uniref:Minichromosome maintenance MCM2/3/5 family protein n=1 Tax=Prunus dulcis TaxID=3755 RepID=A0A4Y1RRB8_PRUDU|nr:minichromosome maintenance MCM2/3/5 family protein [Prunus dulcis]